METYVKFMNLQGDVFECELSAYSDMEELNEDIISAIGASYWIEEADIPDTFREDCALFETGSGYIYPLGSLHEEYFDFQAAVTDSNEDAFFAWIDDQRESLTPNNYGYLQKQFLEAYQYEWNSREDFARELINDLHSIPNILSGNINWEGVIDDLENEYTFLDSPSGVDAVFVFRN